jgi:hypothetical protein
MMFPIAEIRTKNPANPPKKAIKMNPIRYPNGRSMIQVRKALFTVNINML